jgi:hypothetical protein
VLLALAVRGPAQGGAQVERTPRDPAWAPGHEVTVHDAALVQLAVAVAAGDAGALRQVFDTRVLLETVLTELEKSAAETAGALTVYVLRGDFAAQLTASAQGGNFRFLRVRVIEGQTRAVFRLLPAKGQVDYLEFVLDDRAQRLRFTDVFRHSDGETLSMSWRAHHGMPESLRKELRTAAPRIMRDVERGELQAAIDRIRALSPAIRQRVDWLATAASVAHRLGVDEFAKEVPECERRLGPDNPLRNRISADFQLARGDHALAIAAYRKIAARIGGDAVLEVMCGEVMLLQRDLGGAAACAEAALAQEPDLYAGHLFAVRVALRQGDHTVVGRTLARFSDHYFLEPQAFARLTGFAEFEASDAGKLWLERVGRQVQERKAGGRAP